MQTEQTVAKCTNIKLWKTVNGNEQLTCGTDSALCMTNCYKEWVGNLMNYFSQCPM